MKKSIFVILFSMTFFLAVGQDEGSAFDSYTPSSGGGGGGSELSFTSKNGHEVLPKAGDWALGIDAWPVLRYFGNAFNGNTNNLPSSNSIFSSPAKSFPNRRPFNTNVITIYGKKLERDDFAYRGSFSIFAMNQTQSIQVDDDNSTEPDDYLYDKYKVSNLGLALSGGFEHRKGSGRLQGIYGAEAYVHYLVYNNQSVDYANQITASNQAPSSSNVINTGGLTIPSLGYRFTKVQNSSYFEGGVRAFVGVEYFFAPKISIGGEFYLGAGYGIESGHSVTREGFEASENAVRDYTVTTQGSRYFNLGTTNAGGAVNLLFYF